MGRNDNLLQIHEEATEMTEIDGVLMEEANERLQSGTWKEPIQKAMDSLAAGEQNLKWVTCYSGLSCGLDNKFHTFADGRSQYGKSFVQKSVIAALFEGRYDFVTEASGKAAYYEALAKKPDIYRNRILHLDEYNDLSQAAKDFVKAITTARTDTVHLKTVVDQKFTESKLDGLPVVITNSMELSKDNGNQARNRFFIVNVDETTEQHRTVEDFQLDEMMFGESNDEEAIQLARVIVYSILQKSGVYKVLNPFARGYIQREYGERNRLPMYSSLLASITYANQFNRPRLTTDKGKQIILASLQDNLEALAIWRKNEWQQRLKIPERYRKIFEILPEGQWWTKDEISYGLKETGIILSADSVYQYAHKMEKMDLLSSKRREEGREVEFSRILNNSNISVLDFIFEDPGLLDSAVKAIFERSLISNTSIRETAEKLIDCPIPKESRLPTIEDFYGSRE
jgi:hypothetical protein